MVNLHLPSNYLDPVPELDLLAICAYPTEAETILGGTLIAEAAQGHRTGVLDLTPGDVTLQGRTSDLLDQAAAAMEPLGLLWRGNLHYPDGRLENSLPGRMTIAGEIRRLKPRVVLLPHWHHQPATAQMAAEAVTMAALSRLDPETPAHRVTTVVYASLLTPAEPSFVIDVSAFHDRKRAALATYRGETLAGHEIRTRYYGQAIGAPHGEPFVHKGPLRRAGLPGL